MRGATRLSKQKQLFYQSISTHTPHAGRNQKNMRCTNGCGHFNSHAPCGAQRGSILHFRLLCGHFNSHAPCGAQPYSRGVIKWVQNFNSHAPCGAQLRISAMELSRIVQSKKHPKFLIDYCAVCRLQSALRHARCRLLFIPFPIFYRR